MFMLAYSIHDKNFPNKTFWVIYVHLNLSILFSFFSLNYDKKREVYTGYKKTEGIPVQYYIDFHKWHKLIFIYNNHLYINMK